MLTRNLLIAAVSTAALTIAAPALAAPGGGGGPSAAGIGARVNSQGAINASPNGVLNSNVNSAVHGTATTTTRATNSQGLQHASPTGISHSSSSSVLARGAVAGTALPGLTTGLTVQNSSGVTLGTVSQVVTGTDGSIRLVIVTSPSGQTLRLAPTTLSISGGVVTTTGG